LQVGFKDFFAQRLQLDDALLAAAAILLSRGSMSPTKERNATSALYVCFRELPKS